MKLLDAFSLSMFSTPCSIVGARVEDPRAVIKGMTVESFVQDADTARIFSQILGIPVEVRRESIRLKPGEKALIGRYIGPRPEGASELPEGACIDWLLVEARECSMLPLE